MKTSNSINRVSRNTFLRQLALGASLLPAAAVAAQTDEVNLQEPGEPDLGNLHAFVELARSDIRVQKALIIAQNIEFTPDEAVEFWPLHREYDLEFNKLLDLRHDGIKEFFHNHGSMTEDQVNDLAKQAFDLEEKRTALKKKYFKKFIPAVKAARFFQLEHQINMAIDLQIAASLPHIK